MTQVRVPTRHDIESPLHERERNRWREESEKPSILLKNLMPA